MTEQAVYVYARGLTHCSVCAPADMSREEIEAMVNTHNPTGIESRWSVSDQDFSDGGPNPSPCEQANGRLHYLMVC